MTKPLNVNEPVQVCSGSKTYPARVICTDAKGTCPIVVLYELAGGEEYALWFKGDGTTDSGGSRLINIPKRIKGWVNVYETNRDLKGCFGTVAFETKELADKSAFGIRLACIYVDFAEGEGL